MAHVVIKFICHFDEDCNEFFKLDGSRPTEPVSLDDAKSWHAISPQGDGESTICGQVYSEYDRESKTVERGGITCKDCLSVIKIIKQIKL